MKFLNNMKIKTKIRGSFFILMFLSVVLGVTGILSLIQLNEAYSTKLNYAFSKLLVASDSIADVENLKTNYRNLILYADDEKKVEEYRLLIEQNFQGLENNTKQSIALLQSKNLPSEAKTLNSYKELQSDVAQYRVFIDKLYQFVVAGKIVEARNVITEDAFAVYSRIIETIQGNYENCKTDIKNLEEINTKALNTKVIGSVAFLIFILLISLFLSEIISKNIVKSVLNLVDIAKNIAKGNLEVKAATNNRDELGVLSNNMAVVIDTIKKLIDRVDGVKEANLVFGDYEANVDADGFEGSYKTVAESINNLLNGIIKDEFEIIENIVSFGDGDFNVNIATRPGKKAVISENLNLLKDNFKNLYSEINILAECGKKGELNKRINTEKFKGDWRKLTQGLNELLIGVSKPFSEIIKVTDALSKGDLSLRITSEYEGDYLALKNSLNSTMDILSLYIKDISSVLNKMSNKNFDLEINTDYIGEFATIKDSFYQIIDTFNTILSEINSSADELSNGARQISDSSMQLAQGATNQSEVVKTLVASVDMISSQTKNNATNATSANHMAIITKEKAAIGNQEMNGMLKSMEEINESSANISKIIKVIDEIAFQTNLLALNAAVEAARAGQHGKGFAVVAEEVRSLAARSKNAAKETTELIQGSVQKVGEGTAIANQTALTLQDIVNQITDISILVGEVADASTSQTNSIHEINNSINTISEVTQINTATSQEQAAASQELSSQSEVFKNMVSQFIIKDNKSKRGSFQKESINRRETKEVKKFVRESIKEPVNRKLVAQKSMGNVRNDFDDKNFGKYS